MLARQQPAAAEAPTPPPSNGEDQGKTFTPAPLSGDDLQDEATKRLAAEEEERRAARKKRRNRLRELEEIRSDLAERELELLQKSAELQEKEQTLAVLKEEVCICVYQQWSNAVSGLNTTTVQIELEKRLRTLLTKEKEKAEEQAALAIGLCTGGSMLP